MAHFYGSLNGQAKTQATRTGTINSGIRAHVRGWNVGVETIAERNVEQDTIYIYATGGFSHEKQRILVGKVILSDDRPQFIPLE